MQNTETKALIFDIEKFAIHDGPGIRTVVFIKGCTLHCLWCHNPESQSFQKEIFFNADSCTSCKRCVPKCPGKCHVFENQKHSFNRSECILCEQCIAQCFSGALKISGKEMSVSEVMNEIRKDLPFFQNSGGGLTLSGGEPLAHPAFTLELLKNAVAEKINTAVETSGYTQPAVIREILPFVNYWLWDVKALPEQHKKLTGVESDLILKNLQMISEQNAKIIFRCPLIPDVNDSPDNLRFIADLANKTPGVLRIEPEPYHPLGLSKNLRLGKQATSHFQQPGKEKIQEYKNFLKKYTTIPVI